MNLKNVNIKPSPVRFFIQKNLQANFTKKFNETTAEILQLHYKLWMPF